jgi:hypothetical protein
MNEQIAKVEIPLSNWDIVQTLAGFMVFVAVFYSWLFTLSFVNRIVIYLHRDDYKPAVYVVTGANYVNDSEFGPAWWVTGDVGGREERFVPHMSKGTRPGSTEDLLQRFPRGTKIDVIYKPDASDMLSQGESLRVLEARPNLWQEEAKSTWRLGRRVLLPVQITFIIYTLVRVANQRRRRMILGRAA